MYDAMNRGLNDESKIKGLSCCYKYTECVGFIMYTREQLVENELILNVCGFWITRGLLHMFRVCSSLMVQSSRVMFYIFLILLMSSFVLSLTTHRSSLTRATSHQIQTLCTTSLLPSALQLYFSLTITSTE